MTEPADLVAFLRARLAEDEQTARGAVAMGPEEHWDTFRRTDQYDKWIIEERTYEEGVAEVRAHAADSEGVARHIVRNQPRRVLAEVAAKRRIVDDAESYSPELDHGDNGEYAFDRVLRLLALPHSDHPDYRSEWRP